MKLAIIGDSFSSDSQPGSWIDIVSSSYELTNYSLRGISQYRIFDILSKNLSSLLDADAIVIWHTNPDRVYINDEVQFPTRKLALHPQADLVASDSLNSQDSYWKNIVKTYYKIFYNQQQQLVYYHLLFSKIKFMLDGKKVIHCSGFDQTDISEIKSFSYLLETNPGPINHYDLAGNQEIANYISSRL